MMVSYIPCLLMSLLLLPQFSTSDHNAYAHGRSHVTLRSSSNEARTMSPPDCSSIPAGSSYGGNKLALVHPLSPCSPMNGGRSQDTPLLDDILQADRLRLQSLFETGTRSSKASASDSLPVAGNDYDEFPGTLFYTVVFGYGTPAQQFAVNMDTAAGFSYLRCKPCKAGDHPCDQAFDPSLSSTFVQIPCGSPECTTGTCSGQTCTFSGGNGTEVTSGTFAKDTLTLSPLAAVEGFPFACTNVLDPDLFYGTAGVIDLSRNNRSLASRASSPPTSNNGDDGTVAFSYCLPSNLSSHGFLSVGTPRSAYSGRKDLQYAPLAENDELPVFYFVELVGIKVGGVELDIPPTAPIANFTLLDASTTFSYFVPSVYDALRDEFRRQMAKYPVAPAFNGLDTCYNFTGLDRNNETIFLPDVSLEFAGGSSLLLELEQVVYFTDPANYYSVACVAFGVIDPRNTYPVSVIGNLAQKSAELIFDVDAGQLGFAQGVC